MPYPRQHSHTWFLTRWPYRLYMLSELSAIFLAGYTVLMIVLVAKVHEGERAFADYADTLSSPVLIGFHVLALIFALLHTVTWLRAVPVALPAGSGAKKVAAPVLIGAAYVAMLVASAVVLALVLA